MHDPARPGPTNKNQRVGGFAPKKEKKKKKRKRKKRKEKEKEKNMKSKSQKTKNKNKKRAETTIRRPLPENEMQHLSAGPATDHGGALAPREIGSYHSLFAR